MSSHSEAAPPPLRDRIEQAINTGIRLDVPTKEIVARIMDELVSDGPLKASIEQLIVEWRGAAAVRDSFHATMGIGWKACANDLEKLLEARSVPARDAEPAPEYVDWGSGEVLAMAALDAYPIDDGLPKSTSVVFRIHQLGRAYRQLQSAGRAPEPPADRDRLDCIIHPQSGRICERGAHGCILQHVAPGASPALSPGGETPLTDAERVAEFSRFAKHNPAAPASSRLPEGLRTDHVAARTRLREWITEDVAGAEALTAIIAEMSEWLSVGGLFNPEETSVVTVKGRNAILDWRDRLSALAAPPALTKR